MTRPYHRRAYLRRADNEPPEGSKPRLCLKCQAPFDSGWSGERVCRKCKTSKTWREGVGVNMASWSQ